MTIPPAQFPYVAHDVSLGNASMAPMLPLTLVGRKTVAASGLVDSGAAINVLPYSLGVQLGFEWEQQDKEVELSGNLSSVQVRVIVVSAALANFAPVRLAFAWARTDEVSMILGQVNFFLEFDVCFFRSRMTFDDVRGKSRNESNSDHSRLKSFKPSSTSLGRRELGWVFADKPFKHENKAASGAIRAYSESSLASYESRSAPSSCSFFARRRSDRTAANPKNS